MSTFKLSHIFLAALLLFCFELSAQKKKEIKKAGIRTITTTETAGTKTFTDSKVTYDANGNVTEEINYDKEGNLKSTKKFKYNKDGDPIEEIEYDDKGIIKEIKMVKYNASGEKTEETFLDKDKKQFKKYVYTFDSKGFKTERKQYDGINTLVATKKYTYGYK
jgi:YD repeat-containing protein